MKMLNYLNLTIFFSNANIHPCLRIDDATYIRVPVTEVLDDPDYNEDNYQNDFSILTLAAPVNLSRYIILYPASDSFISGQLSSSVSPACLPASSQSQGRILSAK